MINQPDLNAPQRQAPLGVAVLFIQNLRKALNIFVAVVFVNFGSDFRILGLGYLELAYLISAFFLVFSYLQYRRFTFYIRGDNFIIEKGVLKQDKISVPFARIQTVNSKQNIIQQLLGLVGLKIDTAGSVQQEINIPALSKKYAIALQDYLMEKRFEQKQHLDEEFENAEEEQKEELREEKSQLLLKIGFPMLLKVGLSQNHLRSGLILFAIVNGYVWQYEEYLLRPIEPYLEETAASFVSSWLLLLPFAVLVFLVISVLSSLVSTILRYFNFKFYLSEQGLSMESGLLARITYQVPFSKIQYFKWEQNPLQAWLGYRSLRVKQAGAEALNDKKLISIPGLKARQIVFLLNQQYQDRRQGKYTHYDAHVLLRNQIVFWLAVLPSMVAIIIFIIQDFPWFFYLPVALYFGSILLWAHKYWQSYRLRVNENYLELYKGYLIPKRILIPAYKIQNLSVNQSFLQAQRGISTLVLHTAAGSERLRHLPHDRILELYNYLLYKVEKSEGNWM